MKLPIIKFLAPCLAILIIQGCTSVKIQPGITSDLSEYSNAYIARVKVTSTEQHAGALSTNERITAYAKKEIRTQIRNSNLEYLNSSGTEGLGVILDLDITYGVRALRWGVGFGAGKGEAYSTIEVFDGESGETKYSATISSQLTGGFRGGSMEELVEKHVDKHLKAFSKFIKNK